MLLPASAPGRQEETGVTGSPELPSLPEAYGSSEAALSPHTQPGTWPCWLEMRACNRGLLICYRPHPRSIVPLLGGSTDLVSLVPLQFLI